MLPQHYTSGAITFQLVVLPPWHCFRNPDALDRRLCLVRNVRQWLRKTLEERLQDTARKFGCEYCLINIARAWNFFYHRCVKCALSYVKSRRSDEKVIFNMHVLSRLAALLTWAASPGWTSAVTCCYIYRVYHAPVVFTKSYKYVHRFCSSHHSNCLSTEV